MKVEIHNDDKCDVIEYFDYLEDFIRILLLKGESVRRVSELSVIVMVEMYNECKCDAIDSFEYLEYFLCIVLLKGLKCMIR